jgi:hypothetical protein
VPELDTDIPELADESLEGGLLGGVKAIRKQDENVDVGTREKIAASIPSDCDERKAPREMRVLPQLAQAAIDDLAVAPQKTRGIAVASIFVAQRGSLGGKTLA